MVVDSPTAHEHECPGFSLFIWLWRGAKKVPIQPSCRCAPCSMHASHFTGLFLHPSARFGRALSFRLGAGREVKTRPQDDNLERGVNHLRQPGGMVMSCALERNLR